MPDSETICGCNGVKKGDIVQAIHKHGIVTLEVLKEEDARVDQLRHLHRTL